MFAYFIGGPLDLTKKALPPIRTKDVVHYEPVLVRAKTFAHPESKPNQVVPVTRHEYRRMFSDNEYIVYMYEGIR